MMAKGSWGLCLCLRLFGGIELTMEFVSSDESTVVITSIENALNVTASSSTIGGAELVSGLLHIRNSLCGNGGDSAAANESSLQLARQLKSSGIIVNLLGNMARLPHEARKELVTIYKVLLRKNMDGFLEHMTQEKPDIIDKLWEGCGCADIALTCGVIIRAGVKYRIFTEVVLGRPSFWALLDTYIHQLGFDVATDAFSTLVEIVTGPHEDLTASFLLEHFDTFFRKFEAALLSENYMTRRRSLKLLGDLLLRKGNAYVLRRFIEDKHYLRVIMLLLRDNSSNIQFEAFHIFKLFVANPTREKDIEDVLLRNRDKLLAYLCNFQDGKLDEGSKADREVLLNVLTSLDNSASQGTSSTPEEQDDRKHTT